MIADKVDVILHLLVLDSLAISRVMLDSSKNMIMHPSAAYESLLAKTFGHHYLERPKNVALTTAELRKARQHLFHIQPNRLF